MKRLEFLTRNPGWKAASLAGAVLLWLMVGREPQLVSFVSVPVQYKRIPGDLEISSDVVEHVYLELQGTQGLLGRFTDAEAAVTLDFSGVASPGERTFNIDNETVSLPHGMRLVRAIPSQLRFDFERRMVRDVQVEVRFMGRLQEGYRLRRYEAVPPMLTIVGPEGRITHIHSAPTDPIDLSSVVAASQFRVNVFIDDPHVRFQGAPQVTVKVAVEKE